MAKILIVDDDRACRSTLRRALRRWQHDVVEAGDGREAIYLYESFRPELVLLDVVMPERDGFEVLQAIKDHPHRARIIAISGGGQLGLNNYLSIMGRLGATAVLPKPFGIDELEKVVLASLQRDPDILSRVQPEQRTGAGAPANTDQQAGT